MGIDIRHEGVIDSIEGQKVVVRITQSSACSGCQAKSICRAAESKDKLVDVYCADASGLKTGQTVTVAGAQSLGMKAVAFAFGLPLLLLIVALIVAMAVWDSEKLAAVAASAGNTGSLLCGSVPVTGQDREGLPIQDNTINRI